MSLLLDETITANVVLIFALLCGTETSVERYALSGGLRRFSFFPSVI